MKNKIKLPVQGKIVKVQTLHGMDDYTLDNGYRWSDSVGRHKEGEEVVVKPYIMGTVKVEKIK